MAELRKPLADQLLEMKPVISLNVAGESVTLIIKRNEIYMVDNLYSIVNRSGTALLYSKAPIDPHPEVWDDPRWTRRKTYCLKNQGDSMNEFNEESAFSAPDTFYLRTNGKTDTKVTLRGYPL